MQPNLAPVPADPPRARGHAALSYSEGRLSRLYQEGCLKLLLPRFEREAVVVNTSGGLTGGDRLSLEISLGTGESLTVTTQAAERIYRAASGCAGLEQRLTLGREARLDWLPQETILFNGSALQRSLSVDLEEGARFLGLECYVFGRAAHGEQLSALHLRDNWRIRRAGRLIHAEALRLDQMNRSPACFGEAGAAATLVLAAEGACGQLEAARRLLPPDLCAGITAPCPGLLVARLLGGTSQSLRRGLIPLLTFLRGGPVPRVWQY